LGAGSGQILRQTIAETATLAVISGLIALVTGQALLFASRQALPIYLIHLRDRGSIMLVVFFSALLLAFLVNMVACLVPTFDALFQDATEALKDCSGPLISTGGRVLRRFFVALQVSLSFILAVGAILSLQSFLKLTRADVGYNTERVFTAHLNLPAEDLCRDGSLPPQDGSLGAQKPRSPAGSSTAGVRLKDDTCRERLVSLQREILRAAGSLSYVSAVGAADRLPISRPGNGPWVKRNDVERWCPESFVAGDYFRTFQIPFVAGRSFSTSAAHEVVISEKTAEALWPTGNPVGDLLFLEGEKQPRQVVAVVSNTRSLEVGQLPAPQIYVPFLDPSRSTPGVLSMQLVMRCEQSCGDILPALMERLKSVGADVFVDQASTVDDLGAVVTAPIRARSILLSSYAMLGFGLALVGVFVLVSYVSALRQHEIGVRMVLGANPADLVLLTAKEGIISAGIGILVGGIASAAAVQVLRNFLFGIDVLDLKSFAIAGLLLFIGAIGASVLPALRAKGYQPADLLRVV
jgi:ABC-type antimicrobial peptide transport system permease subunit